MGTFLITGSSATWIRSQLTGEFDEEVCLEVIAAVDRWRDNRVGFTVFCDISAIEDYDVAARERISVWLRGLGNAIERCHVLVDGRLIAWALRIVAVTSRSNIVAYHSKAEFEAAFAHHVASDGRSRTG